MKRVSETPANLRRSRMTFLKQSIAAIRGVDSVVYCCVIAILLGYDVIEMYTRSASAYDSGCSPLSANALDKRNINLSNDKQCSSIEGHLPLESGAPNPNPEDAWRHMKWIGKPARCRVKGHQIESLDDMNNFRRGYALKYTTDVEDKTHILPWLLGNQADLNTPERRVLIDLGGNRFDTSVTWFMRMYPCDFTEVHVFEVDKSLFRFPETPYDESTNVAAANEHAIVVNETPRIPQWMIKRMKLYNVLVADEDDPSKNAVNITRFIKETLHLAAGDTVVVKMDVEGSEWPILLRWMNDTEMVSILDELFVEVHYGHASMGAFGWNQFPHTREGAVGLLAELRFKGFFAHAWP